MNRFYWALILLCAAWMGPWAQADANKWVIDTEKTDFDREPLPEQKKSLINWEQDPRDWLDLQTWLIQRDLKDKEPGWKVRQRMMAAPEQIGKVLSCIGDCRLYRGTIPSKVRWLSRIKEGDEIHTGADSYIWILLTDGTLVRMAPETSLGFLEINVAKDKIFFQARLNRGYVFWLPRSERQQKMHNLHDTDPLFLPLMEKEANLTWFQRTIYQTKTDREQWSLTASDTVLGLKEQLADLNRLIGENNKIIKLRSHEVLLVAPNGNILVQDVAFSWFYGEANQSYFKLHSRNDIEEGERILPMSARFMYRGYSNTRSEEIAPDKWMAVDVDGRELTPLANPPQYLELSEVFYKRLTTIMLARERALERRRDFWKSNEATLASNWGYRLWGEELKDRLDFLIEYSRRLETTNLRSLQRLAESLKNTETMKMSEFDERYFVKALNSYYNSLKQKHSLAQESTRDMAPIHYYGWLLKNARQQ